MESVSPDQARKLVASNEVAVIDLRDEEGWLKGHIPGSHRAEGERLEPTLEEISDDQKLLVVCEDGKRSATVAEELEGREAVVLEGGMSAWLSDGLPTQPTEDYEPSPEGTTEAGEPEDGAAADGDDGSSAGSEPAERG